MIQFRSSTTSAVYLVPPHES